MDSKLDAYNYLHTADKPGVLGSLTVSTFRPSILQPLTEPPNAEPG